MVESENIGSGFLVFLEPFDLLMPIVYHLEIVPMVGDKFRLRYICYTGSRVPLTYKIKGMRGVGKI